MTKKAILLKALKGNGVLPCVSGSLRIATARCVNSKWTADWAANKHQETCQCWGGCKVKVHYRGYEYILTKQELYKLISNDR